VTQQTCADSTGTIIVSASGGGTLEYSVDNGANYQPSETFPGLPAGSYNIVVRLQSDPACLSAYAGNPVMLDEPAGCCPATLAVNLIPIPNGPYDAEIEITSNGVVPSGGNVLFNAGMSIELQPGFEVMLGGIFEVMMQGCVP
jgi:hypothetical protein